MFTEHLLQEFSSLSKVVKQGGDPTTPEARRLDFRALFGASTDSCSSRDILKAQRPLVLKTLSRPKAKILNNERLKPLHLKSGARHGCLLSRLLVTVQEVPGRAIMQEKK